VKILIADHQYLSREGLKQALQAEKGFSVVAEAADHKELFRQVRKHKPDIVIIDYHQPEYFSPEDIASLKRSDPSTRILVISSDQNREQIFRVLDMGVKNFLTKECRQEEIIEALHATAAYEKFFCHRVIDLILERQVNKSDLSDNGQLSERETEIIPLIASGLSNRVIAEQLNLSYHTITTHRRNIFRKLGVKNVSELIVHGMRAGLI
jgi:two-component system invasion response regulator UvrY